MASIDENERNGDDKEGYEEYTAWEFPWEPSYERFFRALDAVSKVSKWSNMPPPSLADTVSTAQQSIQKIQHFHKSVSTDFHRDLGTMMSALDSSASLRAIPPGLDVMQRQHDQMMTALGYIKVRRRRYAQHTSSRLRPSPLLAAQPSSPPPMVKACEPDTATVIS